MHLVFGHVSNSMGVSRESNSCRTAYALEEGSVSYRNNAGNLRPLIFFFSFQIWRPVISFAEDVLIAIEQISIAEVTVTVGDAPYLFRVDSFYYKENGSHF